jgi:acetyl coenzyme A synthetase (ADP forming)-like protein
VEAKPCHGGRLIGVSPLAGAAATIDPVFRPRSIAVIGATPRRGTIGHQLLLNLTQYGFNGIVFPVNPKHKFIQSIKCHPSVSAIPDPVDLAVIVVPKEHVADVARECGEKGVRALVIISAGFRETGATGLARERVLASLKDEYGFRIIGPNCMGVINADPEVRMNCTFAPLEPRSGSLAFMTQSGALGVAVLLAVDKLQLGISYFASVGNKVDVAGNDLLEYWATDDSTKLIALYLESFGEPRRFTQLSKRISREKPIVVVKSGTTSAGSRAASSHTGHLAGLDIAVDALLHQCGVIRVPTIEEMMNLALAFTKNPVPAGNRVAVVTNAGGPGIMATDTIINEGLRLAEFSDKTTKRLRSALVEEASVQNPVDMVAGAEPEHYDEALDIVLADDNVDSVIVIFVPPIMVEPRDVVAKIAAARVNHNKPVFSVLMAEEKSYEEIPRLFPDAPPLYRFPESAVRALAAMDRYRQWCKRPEGRVGEFDVDRDRVASLLGRGTVSATGYLRPDAVNGILDAYGFPACKMELVPVGSDLTGAAERVGYPLVLKVYGPEIIHKSDFGGVVVGIENVAQLKQAAEAICASLEKSGFGDEVEGLLVQEMADAGKEIILGMSTDPQFGPLLMFGMGGKYVEIIQDIAFRVMPVTDADAWDMVKAIRSYPLLEGVRGEERVDIEFIVESIQRLAQLINDFPDIAELDFNPVVVTPSRGSCKVVDARIRLG